MPAGPRTVGRPHTRHLSPRFQNTPLTHTPTPTTGYRPTPRSGGLGGLGTRRFAALGPIVELTRGRHYQRDGLARAARICWGRLPRC